MWCTPLAVDRLQRDGALGLAQYQTSVTARVDSPQSRTELLFFPVDPEESFTTLTPAAGSAARNAWGPFPSTAMGFLHRGGLQTYPVGLSLFFGNGPGASVRGLYERAHGECQLDVPWALLLDLVLSELKNTSGEADCTLPGTWCPDYSITYSERVARSYLRQGNPSPIGGTGRGGFGLHFKGEIEFDSPIFDDLSFYGKARYDLSLSDGLPHFEVAEAPGPWYDTWNCSPSPFTSCPHDDVQEDVLAGLLGAPQQLNTLVGECAAVPMVDLPPCTEAVQCAQSLPVVLGLGPAARAQALARGMSAARANEFLSALTTDANWNCAPVKPQCAGLTGAVPTSGPVCQLHLRASDVVPMPDSFSLVWYGKDSEQSPVTAAGALYLALQQLDQPDQLAQLCSEPRTAPVRPFPRVSK